MKTFKFFAIAAAFVAVVACGQTSVKFGKYGEEALKSEEVAKLAASKATVDSVSYLLGVNYGMMFKNNGFFDNMSEVNTKQLLKGIEDAINFGNPENQFGVDTVWAKKFNVSPYDMNKILNGFLDNRRGYQAAFNKKAGEAFLASNAKDPNVKQTASGLQYIIHAEGEEDKIQGQDKVVANYKGTFIDGVEFDSGENFTFNLHGVIPGWTEGLGLVGKGGKLTLFVPGDLAYGERGTRGMEPNMTLIFEIEVVDVIKPEPVVEEVAAE